MDGHECVAECDVQMEEGDELKCVGGCPQWYRQVGNACEDRRHLRTIAIVVPVVAVVVIVAAVVASALVRRARPKAAGREMRAAAVSE